MSVIERAEKRLNDENRQHELGLDNVDDIQYWAAYLDGARAQKKEAEAERPHWLNSAEEMPMKGERVLAYTSHNAVEIVEIGPDECYTEDGTYYLSLIRYWMPLPQPPQEVQDGQ